MPKSATNINATRVNRSKSRHNRNKYKILDACPPAENTPKSAEIAADYVPEGEFRKGMKCGCANQAEIRVQKAFLFSDEAMHYPHAKIAAEREI